MEELMQKAEWEDAEAQLLLGLAYYNGDQKIQRFVGEIMPMLKLIIE